MNDRMNAMNSSDFLLRVSDLRTSFFTPAGEVKAVGGVSFNVKRGEVLGIVGESGSGKSVTMLSVLGLLGTLNPDHRSLSEVTALHVAASFESTDDVPNAKSLVDGLIASMAKKYTLNAQ